MYSIPKDIRKQAQELGAVSFARSYNYGAHNRQECSSIHFFNKEGLQVALLVPCMLKFNDFKITPISRKNPIDYANAQPLKGF